MVIGIGGISRAGKGTLSILLSDALTARGWEVLIMHQDRYTAAPGSIPGINDRQDWEVPGSLNFDAFYEAILDARQEGRMVLAEGLMCFYDPRIRKLFDKKIFIEISWTTFLKRKKNDLRWGKEAEPAWYMQHIWDSFVQYGRPDLDASYIRLNGEQRFDIEGIVELILAD